MPGRFNFKAAMMIAPYYDHCLAANNILKNARILAPNAIEPNSMLTDDRLVKMFYEILNAIPIEIRKAIEYKDNVPFSILDLSLEKVEMVLSQIFFGKMDPVYTRGFLVEPDFYPEDLIPMMFYSSGEGVYPIPDIVVLHLYNVFSDEIKAYQAEGEINIGDLELFDTALIAITLSPFISRPIIQQQELIMDRPLAYMASYWMDVIDNPILGAIENEGNKVLIEWNEWTQFEKWYSQAKEVFGITDWIEISTPIDLITTVLREIPLEVEDGISS